MKYLLSNIIFIVIYINLSYSQIITVGEIARQDRIEFIDTIYGIATDSFKHNLGDVPTTFEYDLVKFFKYTGTDTVKISNRWTTDPHIIYDYPTGVLINDQIYSFKVAFYLKHTGHFYKTLGFILSNGNKITFTFHGNVVSDEKILPIQYYFYRE